MTPTRITTYKDYEITIVGYVHSNWFFQFIKTTKKCKPYAKKDCRIPINKGLCKLIPNWIRFTETKNLILSLLTDSSRIHLQNQ